jgi:hypothetical protein
VFRKRCSGQHVAFVLFKRGALPALLLLLSACGVNDSSTSALSHVESGGKSAIPSVSHSPPAVVLIKK